MQTPDFLDAVKKKHALETDYQLAKFLGWPPGRVSMYRTGKRELDDDACIQIAAAIELPAPYVMACIAAARAKSAESKHAWEKAAKLLKTGSAAVILAAAVLLSQNAPSALNAQVSDFSDNLYIMRRWRRFWVRASRRRRQRRVSRIVTADNAEAPALGNAPPGG